MRGSAHLDLTSFRFSSCSCAYACSSDDFINSPHLASLSLSGQLIVSKSHTASTHRWTRTVRLRERYPR